MVAALIAEAAPLRPVIGHYRVRAAYALVADVRVRTGDYHLDLISALSAEGAQGKVSRTGHALSLCLLRCYYRPGRVERNRLEHLRLLVHGERGALVQPVDEAVVVSVTGAQDRVALQPPWTVEVPEIAPRP